MLAMPVAAQEVTVTGPAPFVPDQVALPAGTLTYSTEVGGVPCRLRYLPADDSLSLSADISRPSLAQLSLCLEPLLRKLLEQHANAPLFAFSVVERDAIVERVAEALDRSPEWNVNKGAPRHGAIGWLIVSVVNRDNLAADLAKVFGAAGYDLKLRAASMISVDPDPAHGGHRLPTGIADLEFEARATKGGG